ncbi:MAG: proline dehydrogenase family protein [Planctomycetota bacterium]
MPLFRKKPPVAPAPQPLGPGIARAPATDASDPALEPEVQRLGRELLDASRLHRSGLLSAKFYSDKLMTWSMQDHEFKVNLFRFVDVFPALRSKEQVHEHLVDYLTQPGVNLPAGMGTGLRAVEGVGGLAKGLMTSTITSQIRAMAEKFIAGTDAESALPRLRQLRKNRIAFSVDLLGEVCVSDDEADAYRDKYLDLVTNLPNETDRWHPSDLLDADHLGVVPRSNVSIKLSSLSARINPAAPEASMRDLDRRVLPILETARDRGVLINFDMEHFALKDLTIAAFQRCCERLEFDAGIAIQAYLKSGDEDAARLARWAVEQKRMVTVRLIKGAYWDYETIHAEQEGWACPVWNEKWQTDACFERMARTLLGATPGDATGGGIKLALGSHNARSIAAAVAYAESRGLPRSAVELQMLHGMADEFKAAAAELGYRVREYVPVGEMIPGMAYLVRRLLENTSNESWLVAGSTERVGHEVLLADPMTRATRGHFDGGPGAPETPGVVPDLADQAPERHELAPGVEGVGDGRPFFTEPLRDFADRDQRAAFAAAIETAAVPEVANDRTPGDAAEMVGRAHAAFAAWRDTDPALRSCVLVAAAAEMRRRRDELSGVIIKENGKNWSNADADVTEAIDFCEYYARLAPSLFDRRRLGRFIGELDEHWHQPRGVAAVVSPWNFPLAIACGMVGAALVTGNTVVFKPAEQTPGIAKVLFDILDRAIRDALGQPAQHVLHFCPAPGETTGAALVRDPRVALIAFTGSKAVGLDIIQAAARIPYAVPDNTTPPAEPGFPQTHVKRVISEMGGKNAIIVDVSADLDEAVLGVRDSAFGFSGQKCSACSRVIVVDPDGPAGPHAAQFTQRLIEASRALVVGSPLDPATDLGPVIDDDAAEKIRSFVERAALDGARPALGQSDFEVPAADERVAPANYITPHVFTGVERDHAIATEEIFGPVLAVLHASSFAEALELANASHYKLTGGVFTRMPAHIERAKREFRVGNLYINRSITGALVGRQPFGGFGLSGVGSKAGGPYYLLQFVEPRASCENTMRRGFAPEL